jgi:membrane protease YdiL (CAAX protease family)
MKKYEILPIFLIFIAEILLFSGYRIACIAVHSLNILTITGISIYKKDIKLVQALSLPSLLRIVNTSLPIFYSFTIYWFASLYGIMFIPIAFLIKEQNLSLRDIGIKREGISLLPLAVLIGIGLGSIEFLVLSPDPIIPSFTPVEIFKLGIVMLLFIGTVEEIIFRSLVQKRFEEKIGLIKGLIIASLMFGIMHSGYSNYKEILFASFAGLVLGFSFQKTKNLFFVVTVHGVNNIILFGVLPFFVNYYYK